MLRLIVSIKKERKETFLAFFKYIPTTATFFDPQYRTTYPYIDMTHQLLQHLICRNREFSELERLTDMSLLFLIRQQQRQNKAMLRNENPALVFSPYFVIFSFLAFEHEMT